MAKIYDSEKVRQSGQAVRRLSASLTGDIPPAVRDAGAPLEVLEGETSRALAFRFDELEQLIKGICTGLDDVSASLDSYAASLEAVEEHLKTIM